MTPGAVIYLMMISGWLPGWIVVARVYTGVEDARYLSIYMLRKARRNLHFHPPNQAWRPSTYERAHSSFVPLTNLLLLHAVAVTTQLGPINGRRPAVF